jgi:mitotic spindle assembly checkpoint protein MAD2
MPEQDRNTPIPVEWAESDAQVVKNAETVKLRHFSTSIHKVDATVAYRAVEDEDI